MLYTLDHLATFSCGQNQGLHHPLDAINKLRLLEKSSGIWTQRMKIKLDKKDLHICSFEDTVSIEKFPLSKVLEPTAVVTEDPNEIYNNILMFTVPQESKKKPNPLSEIHLFQCISVSAQEIVDEINLLKSGAKIKKTPKSYYVPPQNLTGSKSLTNIAELSNQPNARNENLNYLNMSLNYDVLGRSAAASQYRSSVSSPRILQQQQQQLNASFATPTFAQGGLAAGHRSKSFGGLTPLVMNHHRSHADLRNFSVPPVIPNGSLTSTNQHQTFQMYNNQKNGPQSRYKQHPSLQSNGFVVPSKLIPQAHPYKEPKESVYSYTSHDDGAESVVSQQTEHDVMMLNHCFDDIENFISKLQHSHAALRELEKRKAIKKYNKHITGNGMLSLRARPPSEQEFVDIFQKFKLAFNLLARLKNCIHDPNAPELVHFLFRPLQMIVHALKQINYGSSELTHHIVTPLLTNRALDLLRSCLNSRELEFWYSLGEAWHHTQDHFHGYARSFSPVFQDGWQARYTMSEIDKNSDPSDSVKMPRKGFNAARSPLPPIPQHEHDEGSLMRSSIRNEEHLGSNFQQQRNPQEFQQQFLHQPNGLISNNNNNNIISTQSNSKFTPRPFQVPNTGNGNSNNSNGNGYAEGTPHPNNYYPQQQAQAQQRYSNENGYLPNHRYQDMNGSGHNPHNGYEGYTRRQEYGEDEKIQEIPINNFNGHDGEDPSTKFPNGKIVSPGNYVHSNGAIPSAADNSYNEIEKKKRFLSFLKDTRSKAYEVMFDRESKNPKELTVQKSEVIQILEDNRNWWKARNYNNDIGYVPYTILRPYSNLD